MSTMSSLTVENVPEESAVKIPEIDGVGNHSKDGFGEFRIKPGPSGY